MEGKATGEFRLRITKALADQLAETLADLVPARLTAEALASMVEPRPGIYLLHHRGELVYVGKASSNLRKRLGDHHEKLSGRMGIDLADVTFRCAYVDEDLDAAAPEKLLIKKYRSDGKIPWNTNGFGNHDQGQRRDHTVIEEGHFDALYPIDLGYAVELGGTEWKLGALLKRLASETPYTFRYEKNESIVSRFFEETEVSVDSATTVREAIERAVGALPKGWQATALPGALIMYPREAVYESAMGWFRATGSGEAEWTPHKMRTSKQ